MKRYGRLDENLQGTLQKNRVFCAVMPIHDQRISRRTETRRLFESCSHLVLSCLLWSVAAVLETAKILVLQRISDAPTGIDQLHIRKNQSSN